MAENRAKWFLDLVVDTFRGRTKVETKDKDQPVNNREPATQEAAVLPEAPVEAARLEEYLRQHEQQFFSYSELDRANEEELEEKELTLRRDYATFIDQFPAQIRKQLPTFSELKDFSYPEDGNQSQLASTTKEANDYLKVLDLLDSQVPDVEMPGLGFGNGNAKESTTWPEPKIPSLSYLIRGRLQSFIMGAEMLAEAQRKYQRHDEGRAFTK